MSSGARKTGYVIVFGLVIDSKTHWNVAGLVIFYITQFRAMTYILNIAECRLVPVFILPRPVHCVYDFFASNLSPDAIIILNGVLSSPSNHLQFASLVID